MKIYNTLTRKKEPFRPIKKGEVSMYVCGPTVYDEAHIGHARAAYIFTVVRNYLEYKGYKVKFVQNITDIDDKIIVKAKQELPDRQIKEAVKEIAKKYTQRYFKDMDELGIRRASFAPRATEHIGQMKDYIAALLKKHFAYESEGSVYFDVRQFSDYGRLSHQDLKQLYQAVRIEKDEKKKDALDFALWKKAKAGEPFWGSPWGPGRPGWHIECSVMATLYLGAEFDIHAGGQDLIFPHHENEIAQSYCYSGRRFARIWMHNGLLTIKGQKMAKSLGNFVSIKDFLREHAPAVSKLFFLSSHYRSPIDFNARKLRESQKSYEKFCILFDKLKRLPYKNKPDKRVKVNKVVLKFKKHFEQAMEDDFNTPEALAVLFDLVSFCNKLLPGCDKEAGVLHNAQKLLQECGKVFSIAFEQKAKEKLPLEEIKGLVKRRNALREKGSFLEADKIRKELAKEGIILEDTKKGTFWRRKI